MERLLGSGRLALPLVEPVRDDQTAVALEGAAVAARSETVSTRALIIFSPVSGFLAQEGTSPQRSSSPGVALAIGRHRNTSAGATL